MAEFHSRGVYHDLHQRSIDLFCHLVSGRPGYSESEAPIFFAGIVISLAIGSFVAGVVADWADVRSPKYGRILCSQGSIAITLPALWYLFTQAQTEIQILVPSILAGFFLDWTRRGVQQPLAHAVTKPELRSTAMALMEFTQGAFASMVIILFGNFANQYGLTTTLLVLSVGFWSIALVLTTLYYFVYPREAAILRQEMQNRRQVLIGQSQIADLPE